MISKKARPSILAEQHLPTSEAVGFEEQADMMLDIRGEKCPITFVKVKLKLDKMQDGETLKVLLNGGEPMQNVPRQVKEEGHRIIKVERLPENRFTLLIRKGEGHRHG